MFNYKIRIAKHILICLKNQNKYYSTLNTNLDLANLTILQNIFKTKLSSKCEAIAHGLEIQEKLVNFLQNLPAENLENLNIEPNNFVYVFDKTLSSVKIYDNLRDWFIIDNKLQEFIGKLEINMFSGNIETEFYKTFSEKNKSILLYIIQIHYPLHVLTRKFIGEIYQKQDPLIGIKENIFETKYGQYICNFLNSINNSIIVNNIKNLYTVISQIYNISQGENTVINKNIRHEPNLEINFCEEIPTQLSELHVLMFINDVIRQFLLNQNDCFNKYKNLKELFKFFSIDTNHVTNETLHNLINKIQDKLNIYYKIIGNELVNIMLSLNMLEKSVIYNNNIPINYIRILDLPLLNYAYQKFPAFTPVNAGNTKIESRNTNSWEISNNYVKETLSINHNAALQIDLNMAINFSSELYDLLHNNLTLNKRNMRFLEELYNINFSQMQQKANKKNRLTNSINYLIQEASNFYANTNIADNLQKLLKKDNIENYYDIDLKYLAKQIYKRRLSLNIILFQLPILIIIGFFYPNNAVLAEDVKTNILNNNCVLCRNLLMFYKNNNNFSNISNKKYILEYLEQKMNKCFLPNMDAQKKLEWNNYFLHENYNINMRVYSLDLVLSSNNFISGTLFDFFKLSTDYKKLINIHNNADTIKLTTIINFDLKLSHLNANMLLLHHYLKNNISNNKNSKITMLTLSEILMKLLETFQKSFIPIMVNNDAFSFVSTINDKFRNLANISLKNEKWIIDENFYDKVLTLLQFGRQYYESNESFAMVFKKFTHDKNKEIMNLFKNLFHQKEAKCFSLIYNLSKKEPDYTKIAVDNNFSTLDIKNFINKYSKHIINFNKEMHASAMLIISSVIIEKLMVVFSFINTNKIYAELLEQTIYKIEKNNNIFNDDEYIFDVYVNLKLKYGILTSNNNYIETKKTLTIINALINGINKLHYNQLFSFIKFAQNKQNTSLHSLKSPIYSCYYFPSCLDINKKHRLIFNNQTYRFYKFIENYNPNEKEAVNIILNIMNFFKVCNTILLIKKLENRGFNFIDKKFSSFIFISHHTLFVDIIYAINYNFHNNLMLINIKQDAIKDLLELQILDNILILPLHK